MLRQVEVTASSGAGSERRKVDINTAGRIYKQQNRVSEPLFSIAGSISRRHPATGHHLGTSWLTPSKKTRINRCYLTRSRPFRPRPTSTQRNALVLDRKKLRRNPISGLRHSKNKKKSVSWVPKKEARLLGSGDFWWQVGFGMERQLVAPKPGEQRPVRSFWDGEVLYRAASPFLCFGAVWRTSQRAQPAASRDDREPSRHPGPNFLSEEP